MEQEKHEKADLVSLHKLHISFSAKVPTAPNNIQADHTPEGYIQVRWQPPSVNPNAVEQYNVYYTNLKTGEARNISTVSVCFVRSAFFVH